MNRRSFIRFMAGLAVLALPAAAVLPRGVRRRVVEAVRGAAFPGRVMPLELPLGPGTDLAG
jgi:hypothetical protein